jgi:hypothetical protein
MERDGMSIPPKQSMLLGDYQKYRDYISVSSIDGMA